MAYAELAALRPRAGGEYVYLRDAFGPLAAFLTGWTSFVAGFSGAIAASAVVLRVLPRPVRARPPANATPFFALPIVPGVLDAERLAADASSPSPLIVGMASIHLRGVGPGRVVSNVLAALKVAAFVLFIALGFAFGDGRRRATCADRGPVTAGRLAARAASR